MKLRTQYEFERAIRALTGLERQPAEKLSRKIDVEAPKWVVTEREITRFTREAAQGSKRYTSAERATAPALALLKQALTMKPAKVVALKLEDMSQLEVPQQVKISRIKGGLSLGARDMIRDSGIGAILERVSPWGDLQKFAQSIAKDPYVLTLGDVLKELAKDESYDSFQQCNALLQRYFVGHDIDEGDKRASAYKSPAMEIFTNVSRSYDTQGAQVDVKLRPHFEVTGTPGDIVIMKSSLRHSEPQIAALTTERPNMKYGWWGDSNVPSTTTVVIARRNADDALEIVDSVKLEVPVNVAHVKAEKPKAKKRALV